MNENKNRKPQKNIVLTDEERRAYEKLKWYAHYDPSTEENTYGEYNIRLKAWCNALCKKHKMDEDQGFFFQ